ncbi:MAG: LacI family DNA-binding transcriptional regulator [Eubacterium sp.]|nr:LacI family DNA-binding transcriptional regulator [Eubacterium sp.]
MASKVTIQDIADALGVSRNTVSKAINNTGTLADTTKEKVINKAIEMGYKQFSYANATYYTKPAPIIASGGNRKIALLTTCFLGNLHFSSSMLDKFYLEMSQLGYSLTMHLVHASEVRRLQLPASFHQEDTAAIICFEMFDPAYSRMICSLGIPVLFVDSPVEGLTGPLKADRLYMENTSSIFLLVNEMVRRNKTRIGFIGEYLHCQSFFERYTAYRNAMYMLGLPCLDKYCIIENKKQLEIPSSEDYREYLLEHFQKLDTLPDVFLCANDFVAIDVLNVFQRLHISVPKDVYLCGFDDSPEAKVLTPSLTTVHIHSQIMGVTAIRLLMSRIKEPSLNYRSVYTETSPVFRHSTNDSI